MDRNPEYPMRTFVRADALDALKGIVSLMLTLTRTFDYRQSRLVSFYIADLINRVIESGDPKVLPGYEAWLERFQLQTPAETKK